MRSLVLLICFVGIVVGSEFVSVKDGKFYKDGAEWRVLSSSIYPWHDRDTVWIRRIVKSAHEHGLNNIRAVQHFMTVAYQIKDNPSLFTKEKLHLSEEVWKRNDFLIKVCAELRMTVDIEFSQIFDCFWFAGMDPYSFRENSEVYDLFEEYVTFVVTRVNSYTGIPYNEDPAISMWSPLGEHKPYGNNISNQLVFSDKVTPLAIWLAETIKELDSNHIVGIDGFLHLSDYSGGKPLNSSWLYDTTYIFDIWENDAVDYGGVHFYATPKTFWPLGEWHNVDRYNDFLHSIGKPFVVETGVDYGAASLTASQRYFENIFKTIKDKSINGVLLWNWNDGSYSYDLFPGLTEKQDSLLSVLASNADYFKSNPIVVVTQKEFSAFTKLHSIKNGVLSLNHKNNYVQIKIFNCKGRVHYIKKVNGNSTLDIHSLGLSGGTYFVSVEVGKNFFMKKVLIRK